MNLVKSMCAFCKKHKRILISLVFIFVAYKIYKLYNVKEGLVGATSCNQFTNCAQCINGQVNNSNIPCWWNNATKKCGSFKDEGYSRTCSETVNDKCSAIANCQTCVNSADCFWGDRDQKCSSTIKSGYGKICSGSQDNCPKCDECPKLTLLHTPTFITQQ